MLRKGIRAKMEGGEGGSPVDIWGTVSCAKETAGTKARAKGLVQRKQQVCPVQRKQQVPRPGHVEGLRS